MNNTAIKVSFFVFFLLFTNSFKLNSTPLKILADAPVLVMAQSSVKGNVIELSFDKNMADPTGKEGEFSLNISSTISNIHLKTGNAQIIVLELDNRIRYGQMVTVSYMQGTVLAEDDGILESFASEEVINNLVEAPTLLSAISDAGGFLIELKFDKAMSDPSTKESQFSVSGSSSINITDIALKTGDETTIIVNLETAISVGETVTISYTEGDISSTDEGLLDTFSEEPVQNNVVEAPELQSAATNKQGDQIELSFNRNMADPSGNLAQFTVNNSSDLSIINIDLKSGSNDIIILTTQQLINWQDVVTVSYEKGTIQSTDGGYLNSFNDFDVQNNIIEPPNLESASSSADGYTVELVFDKQMKDPTGKHDNFSISYRGGNTFSKAELKQGNTSAIILSLQTAINNGENVYLSYTMGDIQSTDDGYLHDFSDFSVTNNVVSPPLLANAFTNSIGDTIILIFNKEMEDPTGTENQFEINSNGSISVIRISLSQSDSKTFFLELASNIADDATILLSYTKGTIKSTEGAFLESISDHNVANNVETGTWVTDNYLNNKVKLYPNPTDGDFSLEVNELFDNDLHLQIINLKGDIIKNEYIQKGTVPLLLNINIKSKAKGIYYIKLSELSKK